MSDSAEFQAVPSDYLFTSGPTDTSRVVYRFQPVRAVTVGRRGSDFFNRWIELQYGDSLKPATVYLNDGGWHGWRPILTRTNRRIAHYLRKLIPPSEETC